MKFLLIVATAIVVGVVFTICRDLAKNSRNAENSIRWTLVVGAVLVGGMWWWHHAWETSPQREIDQAKKDCENSSMAYVMSQEFVKQRLKSPASADFPYLNNRDVMSVANHDCTFYVSSYVDAQNGFGAKIRTYYKATMKYERDREVWRATELSMN
ncbi:hypothetical protein LU689_28660 [Pseudomonas asiatica]|jgi:hypothetical protein|uniref:hypothetical protein n=1 Tax=Pseudomonas asiatica TaxID=2219225 RepID=UPI000EB9BE9C|nr:hypothetical protein [Pseudomonas asiatica]MCE0853883.1 hypothetical protein [Pseudomonas asiatica]MCE1102108.1 hypothetical protein [Pseudomonas asiatica]MCE1107663.1 hypothetical protein [Pseudomonas asiatica]RFQ01406.1 hypothetical protein D0O09_15315 [Pseudomonas putida]